MSTSQGEKRKIGELRVTHGLYVPLSKVHKVNDEALCNWRRSMQDIMEKTKDSVEAVTKELLKANGDAEINAPFDISMWLQHRVDSNAL